MDFLFLASFQQLGELEYVKQVIAVAIVPMFPPMFLLTPCVPFPFPGQSVGWMNHCGRWDSWLFVPRNLWVCPLSAYIAWMACNRDLGRNGTRKKSKHLQLHPRWSQGLPWVKEVPGRGCGKPPSTGSGSSQALFNVFDFSWAALGVLGKSFGVTALEQQVQLSLMVVSPPVPVHQVLPCQGPTPVVERS